MPVEDAKSLEEEIISILKRYSGRRTVELDQMIARDVGIYGGDGVEIANELEEIYKIDLDPLIQAHTTFLPPNWFDRLRGRKHGPPNADLTVRELIDYIAKEIERRSP